ncbi:MAG: oligosaccharide flippase family protein, partial [Chitinophagaceae bacterium]
MSNVKQNIRNSVFNIADVIFYPLLFLIFVPFFMQHLGEDVFGIWMLMNSLMISFQIFNLGLSPAVVKYVALYRSRNEKHNVIDTITTGIFISVVLMITGIIIGLVLFALIQNGYLFNLSPALSKLAANCMIITSFIIGMKFIEQTLLNVFKGFERYDLYFLINNSIRFIVLIVNITQMLYNKSLESMLIVNLSVTFVMLVLQLILISKLISSYKISLKINKVLSKEMMRFGFSNWIQSLIIILVFQLDRYLIVSGFGSVQLGYYALISTIFINIHSCFSATATWLIPKIVA